MWKQHVKIMAVFQFAVIRDNLHLYNLILFLAQNWCNEMKGCPKDIGLDF